MIKDKRMNSAVPDLTPPGKNTKAPKTLAEAKGEDKPKKEKAPKAEKAPVDPNAPKKERAPRQDYGFKSDAVIAVVEEKGAKYRGQRKDWYDTVKAHVGKKVEEWITATKKDGGDPPRGWLRFFVQDGSVTLSGGTESVKEVKKDEAPANTPPAS